MIDKYTRVAVCPLADLRAEALAELLAELFGTRVLV